MSEQRINYSKWIKRSTNTFIPTDNSDTQYKVDAGIYSINYADNVGFYLFKKQLSLDEILILPSNELTKIINDIKTFWSKEEKFREYGYVFKRGILLHGIPGTGKTCIINLICKHLTEELDGIVITLTNRDDLYRYSSFMPEVYRMIEPKRPIITVIEDLEGFCQSPESESHLLNILDGIEQLENVVYLATTNYIDKLSPRITNRPNRFDRKIEVKLPSAEVRRVYFNAKLKDTDKEIINIEEWVKRTEGLSMAHLGEVIKSVIILGNSFEDTMLILSGLKVDREPVGFFSKSTTEQPINYKAYSDEPRTELVREKIR